MLLLIIIYIDIKYMGIENSTGYAEEPSDRELGVGEKTFDEQVQKIKNDSLNEASGILDKEIQKIKGNKKDNFDNKYGVDYIKRKEDIDYKYLQKYMREKGVSEEDIAMYFPTIDLKDKEVLEEFKQKYLKKGELNPADISESIGDFIKSKMKYDFTFGMLVRYPYIKYAKDNNSKSLGDEKEFLLGDSFNLPKIVSENITKKIESVDISKLTDGKKTFVLKARDYLKKTGGNPDWKNFLISSIDGDLESALYFIKDSKLILNPKDASVKDYIDGYKVGVCRHYSLIAKQMYKELQRQYPEDLGESELFLVIDLEKKHIYNKILYKLENGELKEKIIDITNLIINGDNGPLNKVNTDKQILVNNQRIIDLEKQLEEVS